LLPSPPSGNCDSLFITDSGIKYEAEWVPGGAPPTGHVTVRASRHRHSEAPHTAAARLHGAAYGICFFGNAEIYVYEVVR
jgi:hypothetical protein